MRYQLFAAVLAAACLTPSVRADVTGSILGTVRDSSHAIVVGAQVAATNTATNFTRQAVSDSNGEYRLLALPPGPYRVTATARGFQQFVTTGINLQVNDELRIDPVLEVGAVQQSVTVEANAVQVETESTQLGQVVGTKQILSLPLNGRSFIDLLGLQAGVAPTTSGSMQQDRPVSGFLDPGNISVNGQRETANAFLVNGGDVSEGRNEGAGLIPNLDSIQEFRLITNSFDAEYGKFSGSIMNAITKSGTNSFHGDVFEFLRNDKFDARNFFDPAKAELRRNQFGYAMGGPFIKNKLFWFTDYQGTRQVQGASTGLVPVPSADQRAGIFDPSTFVDSSGNPTAVNGDYWAQTLSQRLGYAVQNGEPYSFTGCASTADCVFPNGVIPRSAFAKPAIGILPYIPLPNQANGFYANASEKNAVNDDKMGQRVDFINQKTGNWSFYYSYDDSTVNDALPNSGASVPGFPATTPTRAQMAVMSNTKTFGPTQVNEFRLSFFRTATRTNVPEGSFAKLSSLGFVTGPGTLGIIPSGPANFPQTVPPVAFNSFSIGVPTLTTFQPDNTYAVSDGFSKIAGAHSIKFGGEFRYLQINERNTCAPNGDFTFNGSETGVDFADFLIGAPVSYNQCSQQFLDSRTRYGALYIQDSYKAKPNLTFNLGLRWEVSMPWYDTQGKIETIVPGEQSTQFPTAPRGWVVPGDPGIPSTLAPTRYNNFAPRAGIAYSPDFQDGLLGKIFGGPGKSSIRAGYGIFYTSIEDLNLFYEVGDAPFGLYWVSPEPPMFDLPFQTRADGSSQGQRFPFTFPIPGSPANKTLDYSVYLPISYSPGYSIHNRLPYGEDYNFSFQRELSRATVLTLSYVGTQGHKLISQYDANPGNAALCMQLNQMGATPSCGPYGEQQTYTLPNGQLVQGTRTFLGPAFGAGNTFTANIANSNFNSLQISAERKAADVTFLLAYTYAKAIDNASGFGDWVNFSNYHLTRALSSYDVTHNFVASYNWAVPFDRLFSGAPKRLTQGWNLVGISRFSTGFPITMHQSAGDQSLTGDSANDTPDLIGPVKTQNAHNPGPNGPNTYFFPDAFASETYGSFGTANRRFFHGPGILNTDFAVEKNTRLTESMAIQFRAEFFNIFNHTQFMNPSGDYSSSTFGVVTTARAPRIGQFSVKFLW
ncbi:MAG TPA: carboxypeptidase regulatory-like domain-containing protein [Bryobacteraceae bacterium]|nr:carboxypeptidase regulatory-like domain-containing protein [Bryobacteraceae bacterium]